MISKAPVRDASVDEGAVVAWIRADEGGARFNGRRPGMRQRDTDAMWSAGAPYRPQLPGTPCEELEARRHLSCIRLPSSARFPVRQFHRFRPAMNADPKCRTVPARAACPSAGLSPYPRRVRYECAALSQYSAARDPYRDEDDLRHSVCPCGNQLTKRRIPQLP